MKRPKFDFQFKQTGYLEIFPECEDTDSGFLYRNKEHGVILVYFKFSMGKYFRIRLHNAYITLENRHKADLKSPYTVIGVWFEDERKEQNLYFIPYSVFQRFKNEGDFLKLNF